MPRLPLTVLAVAAVALPGCAAEQAADQDPPAMAAAGIRADTLAGVARHIYRQEAYGSVGHAAVRRLARDHALVAAMRGDQPVALRAAALRQLFNPGKHVVRLSVLRGTRALTDVGGAFVVAPARLRVHGDVIEASMQDIVGYVKLVHRLAGVDIVVHGVPGHVETSLPGAARATLPASGTTTIAGHKYVVSSFHEVGFNGEPLAVWILGAG